MDIARHVIIRILNPRLLNQMTSCDVARTIHQTRLTGVRAKAWCLLIHAEASLSLNKHILDPHFLSKMTSYDVASTVNHTLPLCVGHERRVRQRVPAFVATVGVECAQRIESNLDVAAQVEIESKV